MADAPPVEDSVARSDVLAAELGVTAPATFRDLRCWSAKPSGWNAFPRVAIVGSRRADPEACHFAFTLGRVLAASGVTVVSGGAFGIDAAAHRGALAAGASGRTLAVIGSGLDHLYPPAHLPLFEAIVRQGAVLSHLPDEVPPLPHLFLERNGLIAALATAVVVVQAPVRSGALSTARAALELGRPLWVCPAAPWDVRGQGNAHLLARGARSLTDPVMLLEALGITVRPGIAPSKAVSGVAAPRNQRAHKNTPRKPSRRKGVSDALPLELHAGVAATQAELGGVLGAASDAFPRLAFSEASVLSDMARQVRDALGPSCRSASEVSQRTALPIARCLAALSELEVAGHIAQQAPGAYFRKEAPEP